MPTKSSISPTPSRVLDEIGIDEIGKVRYYNKEVRNGKSRRILLWREEKEKEKAFRKKSEGTLLEKAYLFAEGEDNKKVIQ